MRKASLMKVGLSSASLGIVLSSTALAIAVAGDEGSRARRRGEPLIIFGLTHTPLGQAELSADDEGNLVVSNIGSSGEDGVVISLGDAAAESPLATSPGLLRLTKCATWVRLA